CRDELTIRPPDLARMRVRVAADPGIVGFHAVAGDSLESMFVAPAAMGHGVGAALFADACAVARAAGIDVLRIESDPNATGFYERRGARRMGDAPSLSISDRVLPLYAIAVS